MLLLAASTPALAGADGGASPGDVTIAEKVGARISLQGAVFKDEKGEPIELARIFARGKPVVLNFIYYDCPGLCNFFLNGFVKMLKKIDETPGDEFEVVTISFDPEELPRIAEKKKANYINSYGKPEAAGGWRFLTGDAQMIARITQEAGFGYRRNETGEKYSHLSALIILNAEGRITRYLLGVEHDPERFLEAIREAGGASSGATRPIVLAVAALGALALLLVAGKGRSFLLRVSSRTR